MRSTAATSRNDTSSRSHGCGILTIKDVETEIEGKLYIIDLAGSERAADSKNHDKVRKRTGSEAKRRAGNVTIPTATRVWERAVKVAFQIFTQLQYLTQSPKYV